MATFGHQRSTTFPYTRESTERRVWVNVHRIVTHVRPLTIFYMDSSAHLTKPRNIIRGIIQLM